MDVDGDGRGGGLDGKWDNLGESAKGERLGRGETVEKNTGTEDCGG